MIDVGSPPLILPERELLIPRPGIYRGATPELLRSPVEPVLAMLPGMMAPITARGGDPGPPYAFINTGINNTSASSYNFGNFNAPTFGLMVVVATAAASAARTLTGISIGGSAGTLIVRNTASAATSWVAIYARSVSSGNNNVTVTFNNTMTRCHIAVYLLWGLTSTTAADTAGNLVADNGLSIDIPLTVPAGGLALYGARFGQAGAGASPTWSSATMRFAETPAGVNTAADKIFPFAGASVIETVTIPSGSITARSWAAAVWR